jgi:hypothetical protein
LKRTKLGIVAHDIGDDGDQNRMAHLGQRFGITMCRLEKAPVFSEKAEFPSAVETRDLRQRLQTVRARTRSK